MSLEKETKKRKDERETIRRKRENMRGRDEKRVRGGLRKKRKDEK